ncbi:MAG: hypothetical protein QXP38_04675 [Nitrososphaerota archaeon]
MLVLGPDVLTIHHLSMTDDERFDDNEGLLKRLRGISKGITIFGLLDLIGIIAARMAVNRLGNYTYLISRARNI